MLNISDLIFLNLYWRVSVAYYDRIITNFSDIQVVSLFIHCVHFVFVYSLKYCWLIYQVENNTEESNFKLKKFQNYWTIFLIHSVWKSPNYVQIPASLKTCSPVWAQQRKGGGLSVSFFLSTTWCTTTHLSVPVHTNAFFSFFFFFSSCASLLVLNIWHRCLVPPVEPRHWSLAPFPESRLVVTGACYKIKRFTRCRLSGNPVCQADCIRQAVMGSVDTNQFATIKACDTTKQVMQIKTQQATITNT